jgi:hypothetical protein
VAGEGVGGRKGNRFAESKLVEVELIKMLYVTLTLETGTKLDPCWLMRPLWMKLPTFYLLDAILIAR